MLRKLFNRLAGESSQQVADDGEPEIAARESYKAFEIEAAPIREGKTWRVAGAIVPGASADAEKQSFVRADTCASYDDAVAVSLRKARQIVDEQAVLAGVRHVDD